MQKIIERGVRTSRTLMMQSDKIWSKYSNDKVDIGETMATILRNLAKALPLKKDLRALSVGSSNEPQFRLFEANFRGGLYLLDIEQAALNLIRERIRRQQTPHVFPLHYDYKKIFVDPSRSQSFLKKDLKNKKLEFISLQHSMYYCEAKHWRELIANLYTKLLANTGAIYCVLMSSKSEDPSTTTWLYNHFAGKFFNHPNDQDLLLFGKNLKKDKLFQSAQIVMKTHRVRFLAEDFEELMSVVWMILLYPHVHRYTVSQRREITEHVYKNFFLKKRPLYQDQDHLVIYRGLNFKGIL